MPKYQKISKIELWRTQESYQDAAGAWHHGRPTQIAAFWGNFKGTDYYSLYQTSGVWANPTFDITITRPKHNAPGLGDHIRHAGKFYIVRQVNDLTGRIGHDMRLTCELDEDYRVL